MAKFLDCWAGNLLGKIFEAANQSETRTIQSDLRKLEHTLSNLKLVLASAEEKQTTEPELTPFLKQLKDAFSEADDLIDELECDYLRWRIKNRRNDDDKVTCISSCSNFAVHASKYSAKINEINERLDSIEKIMYRFHDLVEEDNEHVRFFKGEMSLLTSSTGSQVFARVLRLKREAILSDISGLVFGREDAKTSIIKNFLMCGDSEEQISVFSILGIGGMGKTTLARLVYNDDEVFHNFDKRMWVCVCEDFDILKIRREILSCAADEQVSDTLTDYQLQIRLQRNLNGRKFLLVLDDIWTLTSSRESELTKILKMGAYGSKIIVTARTESILSTTNPYLKIERLCDEESMNLFEYALKNRDLTESLRKVAEEIVPNCNGVPLAIKCLAGLLSSEFNVAEWEYVKNQSEKWKWDETKGISDVLPALKLSYDLMPSYLKPCFLCFSFLPKDHVFFSYELIQLWMAQGLLHSGNKNLELVGEQYFDELWSRGFLEDVEEHALGYWFKIHSLVHDYAVHLAQNEQKDSESLHFMDNSNKDIPPSKISSVRSLIVSLGDMEPKINGASLAKSISIFKQLRYLNLCNSSLEEIPSSIDALKHLRYFDLRGNRRIKRLPELICNLHCLQTLILAFCSELEELPKNIKNMISLRFLWITTKQASLGKDGIGSLKSLRFLSIGGCGNLTQLFEDIDKLTSLQTLIIYDCKSLLSLPKGLESLSGLCNLGIWGCQQLKLTASPAALCLKKLILKGFPALALLPPWKENSYANLEVLEVGDFPKLVTLLDWLGDSEDLRILGISNCPKIEDMPTDMAVSDGLTELRITNSGPLSQKCTEKDMQEKLIALVTNIYVDTRRIKKSQMEQQSTGDNTEQMEEVKFKGF